MGKFKTYLQAKLRKYAGYDALKTEIQTLRTSNAKLRAHLDKHFETAVDLRFRGNTKIIVTSRLNGGTVFITECEIEHIDDLKNRMMSILGPMWPEGIIDAPRHIQRGLQDAFGFPEYDRKGHRKSYQNEGRQRSNIGRRL